MLDVAGFKSSRSKDILYKPGVLVVTAIFGLLAFLVDTSRPWIALPFAAIGYLGSVLIVSGNRQLHLSSQTFWTQKTSSEYSASRNTIQRKVNILKDHIDAVLNVKSEEYAAANLVLVNLENSIQSWDKFEQNTQYKITLSQVVDTYLPQAINNFKNADRTATSAAELAPHRKEFAGQMLLLNKEIIQIYSPPAEEANQP